jgi:hypothetical protein
MSNIKLNEYTGKGIKIAVIDNGFDNFNDWLDINILDYMGNEISSSLQESYHGQNCIEMIKQNVEHAIIFSIDARDKVTRMITEETIIASIRLALDYQVDIINLSVGLKKGSQSLFVTCNDALANNVIVCAANDSTQLINFPSDIDGVISVDISADFDDQILYRNEKIIVGSELMKLNINGECIYLSDSSFATAYFSSVCAKLLQYNPLLTASAITRLYNGFNAIQKQLNYIPINKINWSNGFYVIDNEHINLQDFTMHISPRYKFYFEPRDNRFVDLTSNAIVQAEEVQTLDIINAKEYPISNNVSSQIKGPSITYYGRFSGVETGKSKNKKNIGQRKIKHIDSPVVCIMSYGPNMSKFELQLHLSLKFAADNYKVGNITYNPLGRLFDFEVYDYPSIIKYPDQIYELNSALKFGDFQNDVFLINVPGSINCLIRGEKVIGDLHNLYSNAVNIDVVILCISNFVGFTELAERINEIRYNYGAELFLYVTNKSKKALRDFNETEVLFISRKSLDEYKNAVIYNFPEIPIYDQNDLYTYRLYSELLEALRQ